jgi:autotransporter-associated beta strand protein
MFLDANVNTIFDISTGSQTIAGTDAIAGDGGFSKIGAGKLVLGGSNSYTGLTSISAGILQVDGSIVSATDVKSHARLDGRGTTGEVIIEAGGILSPGDGRHGILHTGDIVLQHHAHFKIQLAGHHPAQLDVTGNVHLAGATLNLSLLGGFHPATGRTFEIIDNLGIDPIHGRFAGLAQGAEFAVGGEDFKITYHGGNGNDVVVTALGAQPAPGWAHTDLAGQQTTHTTHLTHGDFLFA